MCPLPPACLQEVRGNKKREIVNIRYRGPLTLTGGLLESETGPHELSAEFVFRCPTMGLPLRWVSSPSASSVGASLSWAPAVLGLFRAEVVSGRLNLSHGTIDVT